MTRNVDMLVRAARALGDFKDEVVFIGGSVVELFITDPAAPQPRFTEDVDVVVEVTTQGERATTSRTLSQSSTVARRWRTRRSSRRRSSGAS